MCNEYDNQRKNRNQLFQIRTSFFLVLSIIVQPLFAEEEGGAEEVLQGLAAITAATSPAVFAGIQAGSNKAIAAINAANSQALTTIQAGVSQFQAATAAQTSIFQSLMALAINKNNNDGQKERLDMTLQTKRYIENLDAQKQSAERIDRLNAQRAETALAAKAEENRFSLEKAKIELAKVQAGFSSGVSTVNSLLTTTKQQIYPPTFASTSVGSGVGTLATGSLRAFKKRSSDLAGFQDFMQAPRAIASASDAGLVRHSRSSSSDRGRGDEKSAGVFSSHGGGRSSGGVLSIARSTAP